MAYVHISRVPGQGMAEYQAVNDTMGDARPEGQLLTIAGESDGTLHVIDVWESKACADRFAAERLFPAFQRLGMAPIPEATYTDFETDTLVVEAADR